MACHRPAVVFGISYRGEMGRDLSPIDAAGYMPSASTTVTNEAPPPPSPRNHHHHHLQQQQERQQQADLFSASTDKYKFGDLDGGGGGREENDAVTFGDTLGCREMMSENRAPQDEGRSLRQEHQHGGDAPASRRTSSRWSTADGIEGSDDRILSIPTIVTADDDGDTTARKVEENEGLLVNNDGDSAVRRHATKAPEGARGASAAEISQPGLKRNEPVGSWLLDVRLETETAGTALRVSATALHCCHVRASTRRPTSYGPSTRGQPKRNEIRPA